MPETYGLEEVIEKLKNKGIKAGETRAQALIEQAEFKAKTIVDQAREQAEQIIKDAQKEREKILKAMEAELSQAAQVGLAAFKQALEKGFVVPTIDEEIHKVLDKADVLQEAILTLVRGFAQSQMKENRIEILLSTEQKERLGNAFIALLKEKAETPIEILINDDIRLGFHIAPEGQGFYFDFSDEAFREIFVQYLSPKFRKAFYAASDPS